MSNDEFQMTNGRRDGGGIVAFVNSCGFLRRRQVLVEDDRFLVGWEQEEDDFVFPLLPPLPPVSILV
jgi:hypothetical protein